MLVWFDVHNKPDRRGQVMNNMPDFSIDTGVGHTGRGQQSLSEQEL